MKKILAALLALFVLCASAALADKIPPEEPEKPLLGTFSETVNDVCDLSLDWNEEAIVAAVGQDGNYFRVVALFDDRAKELYTTFQSEGDAGEFEEYAWNLPVSYIERITAKPLDPAVPEALVGKTVDEAAEMGFPLCASGGGENSPVIVSLSHGFFEYDFVVDATFEDYLARTDTEDDFRLGDLVITEYMSCCGLSYQALDLRFRADGTLDPGALGMEEHQSY